MKRVGAVAVLVVSVVIGALLVGALAYSNDVYAVNGLPFPIEVEINGHKERLDPDQHVLMGSFSGELAMVARTLDGREIEHRVAVADGHHNFYNPLGAAPLTSVVVTYSAGGDTPPGITNHCGQPFVSMHVHYPFTEPERSISVDSKRGSEQRTAMALPTGGYRRCSGENPTPATAEMLLAIAKVAPPAEGRQLQWGAARLLAVIGQPALARTLAELLMKEEGDLEDHRAFQTLLEVVGDRSVVERYRKAYDAKPSPDGLYLLARVLPGDEAWSLLEKEGSSDNAWIHRGRLWAAVQTGHLEEVLAEGQWCLEHNPELVTFCAEQLARAHVSRGEISQAFDVVESALATQKQLRLDDAVMVARVAAKANRTPKIDPFTRMGASTSPETLRYFRLAVGVEKGQADFTGANDPLAPMALALRSPEAALQRYDTDRFSSLPTETAALLFGEAVRLRRYETAARLFFVSQIVLPRSAVEEWILQGEPKIPLEDMDQTTRAAVLLARARRVESMNGVEAARQLYTQVAAADVLDGLAVRALKNWDPPQAISNNTPGSLERSP